METKRRRGVLFVPGRRQRISDSAMDILAYNSFNFGTLDSDLDFVVAEGENTTALSFVCKREGGSVETVVIWVRNKWFEKMREKLSP